MVRRGLYDNPLVRQSSRFAEGFAEDLAELVRRNHIDVVVWPGFMWQKEVQGAQGIIRETCRDLCVPLLDFTIDFRDSQSLAMDEIKNRFRRYFEQSGL